MGMPPVPNLSKSPAWRRIMKFYHYLKPGLWAMRLPLVGIWLQRAFIRENQDANWFIPVGEAIPVGTQMILPGVIVESLLRQAGAIFAMAACPCRTAFHCANHPWTIGCLHLGEAAYGIPAGVGRLLTLDEGLAHLNDALADGLIPTILYIPSEAEIFRVDQRKMLSICFCCECCCDVRLMLRDGPDRYWDLYNHRMPGVDVVVSEDCVLCGECVKVCYGGERVIRMGSTRAEIHERCIGCGRCIPACPQKAISLQIDPSLDVFASLMERVAARAQIGPPASIAKYNSDGRDNAI